MQDARTVSLNDPLWNEEWRVDNSVITSKYTKTNFVFKFLYERLSQTANFYFLLVGVGQILPSISSTGSIPFQWIVLFIVLFADGIFAAIEDYARHVADRKMNARKTNVFHSQLDDRFEIKQWKNVKVGDILKLENREAVPADVVILAVKESNVKEPSGLCFVETKSLDGETNLKVRQALRCTYNQLDDPSALGYLSGKIVFEQPNPYVHSFHGKYVIDAENTVPIEMNNIALRGTTIRNTPYIYGLVLNTGKDTKIMQSGTKTPMKQSKILSTVNQGVAILMTALVVLCIIGATYCTVWVNINDDRAEYLLLNDLSGSTPFRKDVGGWFIYVGYYWILIASFVPITLYVSIAIVKGYQTYFMKRDLSMYHAETDTPALVRNADLNDDLGQITHIFSDKTGTLTANVMNFRKISINGVRYGKGTTEIGRAAQLREGKRLSKRDILADEMEECDKENVNFVDPMHELDAARQKRDQHSQLIEDFLFHLSICHSVVLEQVEGNQESNFSASSPDELALVSGAAHLGYTFTDRLHGAIKIEMPNGAVQSFEVLEMIEFSSKRKRMSVIARDPSGKIKLFVKGADNIVLALVKNPDKQVLETTNEHLEAFAAEGLRTLVIAIAEIGEHQFETWHKKYTEALADMEQLELHKAGDSNLIEDLENELEQNLQLLGATAIEDRLQDEVPATISSLATAGIRLWVLTGDKQETAINVAYACQLMNNEMDRIVINMDNYKNATELQKLLIGKVQEFNSIYDARHSSRISSMSESISKKAVVIDGAALSVVLGNDLLRSLFLETTQYCDTVVCCRVSPKQKADVVRLFKEYLPWSRVLGIGDGANDVGMIQEAHVGIGISGHEGLQAVNSSDFAIAQFRFLKRLLLVHGHWNYRRMSKVVLYVVYKNIMLYFTLYVLAMFPGGSGTLYNNNLWLNGYNVFWTSAPIVALGVLEQETSAEMAEMFPALYQSGPRGEMFSLAIFTQWLAEAFFESTICAVSSILLIGSVDSYGNTHTVLNAGGTAYTSMITVVWVKLFLNTVKFNIIMNVTVWGTIFFWYSSAIIISVALPVTISDHAFPYLLILPEFYIIVFLCLGLCLGRDFLWKSYKREFRPEYYHILQEVDVKNLDPGNAIWQAPSVELKKFKTDPALYTAMDHVDAEHDTTTETPSSPPTKSKHRGFAFSTPKIDSHFLNPIREIILFPVELVKSVHFKNIFSKKPEQSFQDHLSSLPLAEQQVYEIQRYQLLTGWGSNRPGNLHIQDPPRFHDKDLKFGSNTFSLEGWKIDKNYGNPNTEYWEYATSFRDYRRDVLPSVSTSTLKRKLNRITGRWVRRRRWIPQSIETVSIV